VKLTRVPAPDRNADLGTYDAVLCLLRDAPPAAALARLPYAASLKQLLGRTAARPGQAVAVHLPNKSQTLAVLALARKGASVFEQHQLAGRAVREVLKAKPRRVLVLGAARSADMRELVQGGILALLSQSFELPRFQSAKDAAAKPRVLTRIDVCDDGSSELQRLAIEARAQNLARWLTSLPPNKMDAAGYRRSILQLARRHGLRLRWFDESKLRRLGAGAFLAVAAGNARRDAAGIAQLSYRPRGRAGARPELALVGKGILFDTGGTNLKPHRSMLDMHIDMAGSAVALASLIALAEARAPVAIDAWLAITENRIGPTAYIPQQIVTAANGTTIQVIHTDAEGRMALADTLALASRSGVPVLIDYATLTGAAVYALTERMSALLCNQAELTRELLTAGAASGERLVAFPMDEDFDSDLESKVADIMQCAVEGKGDHMLAARFLQRFVPKDRAWAHIDLAAAQRSGGLGLVASDITGFGVRLTLRWFAARYARRRAK
jgi:leucyl aminopeptidase